MRLRYPQQTLDLHEGAVEHDGSVTRLDPLAVRTLRWLWAHRDRAVPLAELRRHVWGMHPTATDQTVQAALDRIVHAVEPSPERPVALLVQPGVGVRLAPPTSARPEWAAPEWAQPLVGRRDLIEALDHATRGHRLVCVHGPAGIGKTRLVGAWAARRGAAWFDVAGNDTSAAVLHHLADRLAVRGHADLARRIVAAVQAAGLDSVVLDGLDGLGQDHEDLLAGLTEAGPQLRLVALGRRRPGLEGASFLSVPPLPIHDALSILQAVAPQAPADPDRRRELVRTLSLNPLAIELVASWWSEPPALTEDPDLSGLDRAIEYLWTQFSTPLRHAAHHLSAFRGGLRRDAAELAVGSAAALGDLEQRGFVVPHPDPRRLRVPPAVRDWLQRELGPPPHAARQRQAAWLTPRARAWRHAWPTAQAGLLRTVLVSELANLSAAARWAVEERDPAAATLALALATTVQSVGRAAPAGLLEPLRGHPLDAADRSAVRLVMAQQAGLTGRPDDRARLASEAQRAAPPGSAHELDAAVELARATLAHAPEPDLAAIEGALRSALAPPEPSDARRVGGLSVLGDVHRAQGRPELAQAAYTEAMRLAARQGLVEHWSWAALQVSDGLAATAAHARADELLDQIVAVSEGAGLPAAEAQALLRRSRRRSSLHQRADALADLKRAGALAAGLADPSLLGVVRLERGARTLESDGRAAIPMLRGAVASYEAAGRSDQPEGVLANIALAQALADADHRSEARRVLDRQRKRASAPPLAVAWHLVHALLLALDGQLRSARAAADALPSPGDAPGRLEVAAAAVRARVLPGPEARAQWLAVPIEGDPEREALARAVAGEPVEVGTWWLVRQLVRIPEAAGSPTDR